LIVGGTVAAAAVFCGAAVNPRPAPTRGAADLGAGGLPLGTFRLEERSGGTVTDGDLAGRVWVAGFIFTRCPSSCPRITAVMKGLEEPLRGTGVRLVSISVDPQYDRPAVLADFARRYGADPARWWFLTGPPDEVHRLIVDRFKLPAQNATADDRRAGAEAVSHSTRLALINRGNTVAGYFDSNDPAEVRDLLARAKRLDREWIARLPAVNATLNASSGILLVVGWTFIRRGRPRSHAACMVSALVTSALFLASYLVYHFQVGSVPFRGAGLLRLVYFTILLSHTALAITVVPLVTIVVTRALQRRFTKHVSVARLTFPIWLYVSATGVIVYLMLYQLRIPDYPG
jgi:protein SCO1/2/putative membrane protein